MKTIENNKLIAEFMGAVCTMEDHTKGNEKYCKEIGIDKWLIGIWSRPEGINEQMHTVYGFGGYRSGQWLYHSSWDWLMPVVEKIFKTDEYIIWVDNLRPFAPSIRDAISCVNLLVTYETVVEFIKWYNQQ